MRKTALALFACAAVAASALAQTPTRSIEDYECGLDPESCAASAPAEKGPVVETRGAKKPRVTGEARAFSLSSAPKPIAPKGAATDAGKPGQRVDLLLTFEIGSAQLTPTARAEARVFAQALSRPKLKGMRFAIEGHTDSSGGLDYNLDLSRRRAESAAEYLMSQGVERGRLEVRGLGYSQPLPGRSAASPDNRRVEAVRLS